MMQRLTRILTTLIFLAAAMLIAACGSIATPEWAADIQATEVAQLATDEHLTAIAPTLTPTNTPRPSATPFPTETPLPTSTPVPPTNTPIPPTATDVPPTAVPTVHVPEGDAANGQRIFNESRTTAQGAWSCSLCHSVTPDEARLIGPGLFNVSVRAESRIPGVSAYDYIHDSILHPQAFIVPADAVGPYPENLMPQNYEEVLTPAELEDVITYLFSLK